MGNVQLNKMAVDALLSAEFRRWFAEFDVLAWDARIEADVAAGKLDQRAAEALADHHAGMQVQ